MDRTEFLASIKAAREGIEARKASGINTVSIPQGRSRWRILPGWRPGKPALFYHDFGKHWIKDSGGKVVATYVCDRDTFGKPCDICNAISEAMRATKDDKALEAFKQMFSRRRVLVNALLLEGGDKPDPMQPRLLEMPTSVFEGFVNLSETRMADDIMMLDPNEGRDIFLTREGADLNTKYGQPMDAPKNTAVHPDVLNRLINIDAFIEAERQKGIVVGVAPLNEVVKERLKLPSSAVARGASLFAGVAGAGSITGAAVSAAPALEAGRRTIEVEPVATVDGTDEEIAKLLADLDA